MAKFSKHNRIRPKAPVMTHGRRPVTRTHEGAPAYAPDLESELFLMAATHMADPAHVPRAGASRSGPDASSSSSIV